MKVEILNKTDIELNESIIGALKQLFVGKDHYIIGILEVKNGEKDFVKCLKVMNNIDNVDELKIDAKQYVFLILDSEDIDRLGFDPENSGHHLYEILGRFVGAFCTECSNFKKVSGIVYLAYYDRDEDTIKLIVAKLKSNCKISEVSDKEFNKMSSKIFNVASNIKGLFESENAEIKLDLSNRKLYINYDPDKLILNENEIKEFTSALRDVIEDLILLTYFNENDIVYTFDENGFINEDSIKCYGDTIPLTEDIILTEATKRKRLIPPKIKELIKSRTIRKKMLIACGKDAFLLPEELKFPVKYPVMDRNGNVKRCEYHCGLIVAAYYRANEWKKKKPEYEKIAKKAVELYKNSSAIKIPNYLST